jgi:hypothetical protein
MTAGIASTTSQFGQQTLGRAIDTRLTIEVDAGTLCQVLLTKPRHLPAVVRRACEQEQASTCPRS